MNNDKIFTFLTTSALAVCIVNFGVKSQEKLADMHDSEIVLSLGAYSNNYSYNEFEEKINIPATSVVSKEKTDEYVYKMPKKGVFKARISKNNFINKEWL